MRQSISEDDLINYLKKWCVKDQEDGQDLEGADFTSTVEHIHNVYSYLHEHCNQNKLKELFQHNPAVFMEHKYILSCLNVRYQVDAHMLSPETIR